MINWQVWGCGSESEHRKQQQQRDWEKRDAQKHRDRKVRAQKESLVFNLYQQLLCFIIIQINYNFKEWNNDCLLTILKKPDGWFSDIYIYMTNKLQGHWIITQLGQVKNDKWHFKQEFHNHRGHVSSVAHLHNEYASNIFFTTNPFIGSNDCLWIPLQKKTFFFLFCSSS